MNKIIKCDASLLQALADHQLSDEQLKQAQSHLENCASCQQEMEEIQQNNQLVAQSFSPVTKALDEKSQQAWDQLQDKLATLQPSPIWESLAALKMNLTDSPISEKNTDQRLIPSIESLPIEKSRLSLQKKNPWTRIGAIAAIAVLAIGFFSTQSGKQALAAMLQTFQVQHLATVDGADLKKLQRDLVSQNGGHFDLKQYGQVEINGDQSQQLLSLSQIEKNLGHKILLLPGTDVSETNDPNHFKESQFKYQGGVDVILNLNVGPINQLLHQLGGKSEFPASIDHQPITLHVPPVVSQTMMEPNTNENLHLEQLQVPSLDVPGNVDVNQVRQALLDLPLLPSEYRQTLLQTEDWKSTLIIGGSGHNEHVSVNGNEGILHTNSNFSSITWLQNGSLYTLTAPSNSLPKGQSILDLAKEIAK